MGRSVGADSRGWADATPFLTQLRFVVARNNNALWRNPDYQFTKLFNHAIIALIVGLTFLQVGNSTADLQFRVFAIFFASVMPALIISQIEPMWLMARDIVSLSPLAIRKRG